jgi:hypothetical protein
MRMDCNWKGLFISIYNYCTMHQVCTKLHQMVWE